MGERHRILIVEDAALDADLIEHELSEAGLELEVRRVETSEDLVAALATFRPDVVLSDYNLPRLDGMTALRHVKARAPHVPFILVTGSLNEETAVDCMKAGADDYVLKDRLKRIGPSVLAALGQKQAETAKESAEQALRESERRYRTVVDSLKEIVFQTDGAGRWTFLNPAWTEITGYSIEESLGRPFVDFVHPEDREAQLAVALASAAQGESTHSGEFRYRRKDGGQRWVEGYARFHRGFEGAIVAGSGTLTDITERKEAEAEQARLRSEQARLRDALASAVREWQRTFDSLEFPILIAGALGRVARINRAGRDLLGRPFPAIVGQPLSALSSREPWLGAARLIAAVAASRTTSRSQARDGETGQVWSLTARPLEGPSPDDPRVILDARDVTRETNMQEDLRRGELLAAMGSLVAGVAHEVRNPLFSISSNIDAFEAELEARHEHAGMVKVLRLEVARLSSLMQDLLDYGRPSAAEREVSPVEGVVREALERCEPLACDVAVSVSCPEGDAVRVPMDRNRLSLVFRNLIENAIQHAPPRSEVAVIVAPSREGGRDLVEVRVEDRGPGFHEEDLTQVFAPFFSRRRGGTGLGLSIVHKVVVEHGGQVVARNRPGGGASLCVKLPRAGPLEAVGDP
jgi:PAS domain S-box-containing protein